MEASHKLPGVGWRICRDITMLLYQLCWPNSGEQHRHPYTWGAGDSFLGISELSNWNNYRPLRITRKLYVPPHFLSSGQPICCCWWFKSLSYSVGKPDLRSTTRKWDSQDSRSSYRCSNCNNSSYNKNLCKAVIANPSVTANNSSLLW